MGNKMCTCTEERLPENGDMDLKSSQAQAAKEEEIVSESVKRPVLPLPIPHNDKEKEIVEFDVREYSPTCRGSDELYKREKMPVGDQYDGSIDEQSFEEPKIEENSELILEPYIPPVQIESIAQVQTPVAIQMPDTDFVYIEGDLDKYKPGISAFYIKRWCQLTKTHFNYYKNNWAANCWLSKPLLSIPLSCIELLRKVQLSDVPKKFAASRRPHFEISLKDPVHVSDLQKSIDYSSYETRGSVGPSKWSGKSTRISASTKKVNRGSASVKRKHSKTVTEGHLMKTPTKTRRPSLSQYHSEGGHYKSGSMQDEDVEKYVIEYDNANFPNEEEKRNYEAFKRKNKARLCSKVAVTKVKRERKPRWAPTISSISFYDENCTH